MASPRWKDIAAKKQAERSSRIPKEWTLSPSTIKASQHNALSKSSPWRSSGIMTDWELRLTDTHDATSLQGLLTTGAVKSEDVVRAFCKRAAIAQQLINCLTEIMFDSALKRAQELDAHMAKTGRPIGPLHGLPISLKDTFKITGVDASVGIASLCFQPATEDSALVTLLLAQGCVLYTKTNVPQTMMALDSHNNVFGRTLNPRNNLLTPGGSSGGEGALIAMRGSVLGVGTDVGGSIRIPAACNGLFGIKPSVGFVPYAGQEEGSKLGAKKLAIEPTAGPIAHSLRDCEMFLRVVADANPGQLDHDVVIDGWNRLASLETRKLTVGIVRTDGHVRPLPPIEKVIDEVAKTLGRAGQHIQVIEVDVSGILSQVLKTFNGIISIDGANTWFDHLDATGEPLSPWLQGRLTRRPVKNVEQVRELQAQKMELQAAFLRVWQEKGIDAIIMPMAPHPVLPIDRWNTVNYTGALNLLDLPAGIIPVRTFKHEDTQGQLPNSKPLNGWDKINREHWAKVDPKLYIGSPLSVQIVTPRLTERRLVDVMSLINAALEPLRTSDDILSSKL